MTHTSRTIYRLTPILLLLALLQTGTLAVPTSLGYQIRWIHRARVHVVTVNLNDPTLLVTPAIAHGKPGRLQSFSGFLAQHKPYAQITGSYFGLRDRLPIGDIVINRQRVFVGPVGSALGIRPDNTAAIVDILRRSRSSWPGYESVVQGGVRLLRDGKNGLSPRDQGFHDPGLFRQAERTAVGVTVHNKLLMVAVSKHIYLSQLRDIMLALGCRDAMTMDGGTSAGLAFGGNIIMVPGRSLSNVLMVVRRPSPPPSATPTASVKPTALTMAKPAKFTAPWRWSMYLEGKESSIQAWQHTLWQYSSVKEPAG